MDIDANHPDIRALADDEIEAVTGGSLIARVGQMTTWFDSVYNFVKGGSKDYGSGTCNTDGTYTLGYGGV